LKEVHSPPEFTVSKNMQHVLNDNKDKFKSVGFTHTYLLVVY